MAVACAVVAFVYLGLVSIALTWIDIRQYRLPDIIVLPSYVVAGVLLAASALVAGQPRTLVREVVGAAVLFVLYAVIVLIAPRGMGFGDVKLAGLLGLYLGWCGTSALLIGTFAAFFLGALFALILLLARRADLRSDIPFGPWMLLGAWLGAASTPLAVSVMDF